MNMNRVGQREMTNEELAKMNQELNQIFGNLQLNLNDAITNQALIAAKELNEKGYMNDRNKQVLMSIIGSATEGSVVFLTTLFTKGFEIQEDGKIVIDMPKRSVITENPVGEKQSN